MALRFAVAGARLAGVPGPVPPIEAALQMVTSIAGFALSPIPFFLLVFAINAFRGELFVSNDPSNYVPWRSIFTIWYAAFGVLLGGWIALTKKQFEEGLYADAHRAGRPRASRR